MIPVGEAQFFNNPKRVLVWEKKRNFNMAVIRVLHGGTLATESERLLRVNAFWPGKHIK